MIKGFLSHPDFEITDISNTMSIARIKVTQKTSGQMIKDIAKRIKIIAFKKLDESWDLNPNEDEIIHKDDAVMVIGDSKEIRDFDL